MTKSRSNSSHHSRRRLHPSRTAQQRKAAAARRAREKQPRKTAQAQDRLYHALQDPVVLPPDQLELPKLRALVVTLTSQRDDALQIVNDRANISTTVSRLGSHVFALRTAVEEIGALTRQVKAETEALRALTQEGADR